jgi:hypothetical protein
MYSQAQHSLVVGGRRYAREVGTSEQWPGQSITQLHNQTHRCATPRYCVCACVCLRACVRVCVCITVVWAWCGRGRGRAATRRLYTARTLCVSA